MKIKSIIFSIFLFISFATYAQKSIKTLKGYADVTAVQAETGITPKAYDQIIVKSINTHFFWDATSTATHDGISIIKITSITTGRFLALGGGVSSQPLTWGRINASANLPSLTYSAVTGIGSPINFNASVYANGMTITGGGSSITPSVAGRYKASWLAMASSNEFVSDGTYNIVQNGVVLGSVFINQMEAAGVNQTTPFIDVDLVAGQPVTLNYQPPSNDAISFDRGSYFQLTQLPTAVAPVVNTVAEYGEVGLTDGGTFTSTLADIPGSTFTLPSAGVWEVTYNIYGRPSISANSNIAIYDNSNVIVPNSSSNNITTTSNVDTYISQTVTMITTAPTTYKLRGMVGSGTYIVKNVNGSTTNTGGSSKVFWTKIAGQLPSTGSTVDFLDAMLTSDAIIGNGGTFQFVTQNGTLTNASGIVTLPANKTFYYSAKVAKTNADGTNGFAFQFRNLATNTFIGSRGQAIPPGAGTNEAPANIAWGTITTGLTPVNIRLENTEGGTRTAINGQTSLYIVQIGSTATTGTPPTLDRTDIQGISSSALTDMFTYSGEVDIEYDTPRSAATALQFTNINASSSGITVGTNVINITKTGFYRIQVQESLQTAQNTYMQIVRNGTNVLAVSYSDVISTILSRSALWGGELFAGDVIDIRHGRTANAGNDSVKSFNIHITQVN